MKGIKEFSSEKMDLIIKKKNHASYFAHDTQQITSSLSLYCTFKV
jgi:hypothetical protein